MTVGHSILKFLRWQQLENRQHRLVSRLLKLVKRDAWLDAHFESLLDGNHNIFQADLPVDHLLLFILKQLLCQLHYEILKIVGEK